MRPTVRTAHEREHSEQRFGAAAQTAEWGARYRERDGPMSSGRPIARLLAEVADLSPGQALDVGRGEGAGAIWLARRGWAVTAISRAQSKVPGRLDKPARPSRPVTGADGR
jgi:2-polyprenyl-3-methyl-5-hydroxy-6-metoxy-1,4-benzoquinol methylase